MIVQNQQEYLSQQYPMIATPCYGGMVTESYLRGMLSLVSTATTIGMNINMSTVVNESLVTRARNELVKYLTMTDCTHLFFIDADIMFTESDIFRLLLHDADVVVGTYPLKRVAWENIDTSQTRDVKSIQRMATDYVVNIKYANEEQARTGQVPVVEGLIELHDAGTGFMCIKRHVIEKMMEAYPETHYLKEPKHLIHKGDDGHRWALFDTMIDEDNRYLSEDYTFCRRWQQMGGKIWLDPEIELSHIGTFVYPGVKPFDLIPEQSPTSQGLIGG